MDRFRRESPIQSYDILATYTCFHKIYVCFFTLTGTVFVNIRHGLRVTDIRIRTLCSIFYVYHHLSIYLSDPPLPSDRFERCADILRQFFGHMSKDRTTF